MSDEQLDLGLNVDKVEPEYICYMATHIKKEKRYIGITERDFNLRKSEHLSHAKNGTDNTYFHQALRRQGADNFKWDILAKGIEPVIRLLEKTLILKLDTMKPKGYNSINEAYESSNASDEEVSMFADMNKWVEEIETIYNLQDMLNGTKDNRLLPTEIQDKIKDLIKSLNDCEKNKNYNSI